MKHVRLKEQAICATPFFVEAVSETTCSAYHDIDCVACLRQAIAASEVRSRAIHELITKVEALS